MFKVNVGRSKMWKRIQPLVATIWLWFRSKSLFVQCLLVIPILCAIAFTALIGNVGLALMGGAIALSGPIVGWLSGAAVLILGKATSIIWRDRSRSD
ncbi:hypothetical protein [Poseidonocella sedimentorum]|uniref:hypothetical protein n=1 Tax=Poseidonocella sedimentorum TaxID=871652 RepID=UPI001160D7A6|nr:hypothetical protein [Poseidonocella sedimentorum]